MADQTITIPRGWKMTTLGQVADVQTGPFGSQLHNDDYVVVGTPIITVENLVDNKIVFTDKTPKVTDRDKLRLKKYSLKEGDIVFSRVGSVDRCAYVSKRENDWLFSGRLLRVRPDDTLSNSFVFYWMSQKIIKEFVRKIAVGATMPSINTSLLSSVPVAYPPLTEQHAIAAVLASLDYKIELLREQNKTLEATAQAIFKEWFVNFNFPGATDKIIDSELGKIPAGWRAYELRDVFTFVKGKKPNSTSETFISGFLPQILIDTLDGGKIVFADSKNTVLSKEEDLVMVMDGASSGRIEFGYSGIIGSTLSLLDFKKECKAIMYFFLKNKEVEIKGSTTGSAIPHTDKEKIYQYSITLPQEKLGKFESALNSFRKKVILNRKSIQNLSALRDALLSRLMKGEVRVTGFND